MTLSYMIAPAEIPDGALRCRLSVIDVITCPPPPLWTTRSTEPFPTFNFQYCHATSVIILEGALGQDCADAMGIHRTAILTTTRMVMRLGGYSVSVAPLCSYQLALLTTTGPSDTFISPYGIDEDNS